MIPQTKRAHLRELVADKNRWHRPLTKEEQGLGFLGWHQRGYLPHCDYPDLIQLVTFRLVDSMPIARRGEWEHLLSIEDEREKRTKLEEYLDRGLGSCRLRDHRIARIMEGALLHFHGERYDLLAWCVMPNHVHVLVQVMKTPLSKLMQSWKRYVATHCPERRSPTRRDDAGFWQREYWDTFMRNEDQIRRAIHYIENNPLKAGLCKRTDESQFSSARFRDQHSRLVIPMIGRCKKTEVTKQNSL
jgi:putative transposase